MVKHMYAPIVLLLCSNFLSFAVFVNSAKGYITGMAFRAWLEIFVGAVRPTPDRKALIILDNHSSRFDGDMLQFALDNNVILLSLPPNTTPFLQPLDVGVFGPFKKRMHSAVTTFCLDGSQRLHRLNVASVVKDAWLESVSVANIKAGFATTGIWPLNRFAVPDAKLAPHAVGVPEHVSPSITMLAPAVLSPVPGALASSASTGSAEFSVHKLAVPAPLLWGPAAAWDGKSWSSQFAEQDASVVLQAAVRASTPPGFITQTSVSPSQAAAVASARFSPVPLSFVVKSNGNTLQIPESLRHILYAPHPLAPGKPKASHKQSRILTAGGFIKLQQDLKCAKEQKNSEKLQRKADKAAAKEAKKEVKEAKKDAKAGKEAKESQQKAKSKAKATAKRAAKVNAKPAAKVKHRSSLIVDSDAEAEHSESGSDLTLALGTKDKPKRKAAYKSQYRFGDPDESDGSQSDIVMCAATSTSSSPSSASALSSASASSASVSAASSSEQSPIGASAQDKPNCKRKRDDTGDGESFGFLIVNLEVTATQLRPFGVVKLLESYNASLSTVRAEVWEPVVPAKLFGRYQPCPKDHVDVVPATVHYSEVELDRRGSLPGSVEEEMRADQVIRKQLAAYAKAISYM